MQEDHPILRQTLLSLNGQRLQPMEWIWIALELLLLAIYSCLLLPHSLVLGTLMVSVDPHICNVDSLSSEPSDDGTLCKCLHEDVQWELHEEEQEEERGVLRRRAAENPRYCLSSNSAKLH